MRRTAVSDVAAAITSFLACHRFVGCCGVPRVRRFVAGWLRRRGLQIVHGRPRALRCAADGGVPDGSSMCGDVARVFDLAHGEGGSLVAGPSTTAKAGEWGSGDLGGSRGHLPLVGICDGPRLRSTRGEGCASGDARS